jgi:hypothetical protein
MEVVMGESKHVTVFRNKHLKPAEEIIAWGEGYIGDMMGKGKDTQHNGVLIVSQERVVFYRKGLLGEVLETIPLKSITSIERKSLLGHRTLKIHTSHDALEFKTFDKKVDQSLSEAIETNRHTDTQKQQTGDPLEILKKLAELRDAGIITEDEFLQKKQKILALM